MIWMCFNVFKTFQISSLLLQNVFLLSAVPVSLSSVLLLLFSEVPFICCHNFDDLTLLMTMSSYLFLVFGLKFFSKYHLQP